MVRAVFGWLGLLFAVIAGLAAAGAAMWFLAPLASSLALLALAALAIGFGVAALLGGLLGRWTRLRPRARALAPAGVAALALAGFATWLVTSPLPSRTLTDPRPASAEWTLSTGSHIATWTFPGAADKRRATPVLFLHGGAGGRVYPRDFGMGAPLRAAGFDTIYFDQAGSGRSADLAADAYSVARSVADVEAMRTRLGAEQIILWGESWGTTLAAAYGLAHPDRLAAIIASSPGEYPGQVLDADYARTDDSDSFSPPPRMAALFLLLGRNPALAEQWLPQAAHHQNQDAVGASGSGLRCKGAAQQPLLRIKGGSLYVLRLIRMDVERLPDPGPAVQPIPALIVRGECDFVPVAAADRYAVAYRPARRVAVPGAGHILLEHEADFERAAARFAAEELAGVK